MREIAAEKIKKTISDLSIQANVSLRRDVLSLLKAAYAKESNARAKEILKAIIKNALIARREKLAICQDTGFPFVFVELGQDVKISGNLKSAINKGIESGYRKGYFRESIIKDPLLRTLSLTKSKTKSTYQGAIIHTDIVAGNKLKITVLPKGFGCENKSGLKMFNPTARLTEIKKFIIDTIRSAGADACPPYIVGVGIGGTADYAMLMAKRALLINVTRSPFACAQGRQGHKVTSQVGKLERDLVSEINKLNIGPMGLGGKTTALAVKIETYPTHIAGLPVAVNISCHALRSATTVI